MQLSLGSGLTATILYACSLEWIAPLWQQQMLLILDLQIGLYQLARDFDATLYRDNMIAHSAIGQIFDIPVVMTTSAQEGGQSQSQWITKKLTMLFPGPNGPLPAEILKMYPKMPLIQRNGEVNAWDNPEFRAAIRATGKKQIIVAGIVTDVCKLP
jgi:nicotinamidase-related amidase